MADVHFGTISAATLSTDDRFVVGGSSRIRGVLSLTCDVKMLDGVVDKVLHVSLPQLKLSSWDIGLELLANPARLFGPLLLVAWPGLPNAMLAPRPTIKLGCLVSVSARGGAYG